MAVMPSMFLVFALACCCLRQESLNVFSPGGKSSKYLHSHIGRRFESLWSHTGINNFGGASISTP